MKKRMICSVCLNSLFCVTVLVANLVFNTGSYGQPPNDNCVDVTPQPCPIQDTGNNENATNDGLGVCDAEWWGPETWHAFIITGTSDVRIVVCGLENYWSDGWEYVTLLTACSCDNVVPANDWNELPPECSYDFGGYAVTWNSLPAGTYYYPVLNSFAVNGSSAHGAYTVSITCTGLNTGRCCYGCPIGTQCATNDQATCAQLGGIWTQGIDCNTSCPPPPPPPVNDDCSNVIPMPCPINETGDNRCATFDANDCVFGGDPETWHGFTIDQTSDVHVNVCALEGAWSTFYVWMARNCPCTDQVTSTHYSNPGVCPSGDIDIFFDCLPAGTYYYPVLNHGGSNQGPYSISIDCTPCTPCSSATQATVVHAADVGNSVDIRWFASQNFGHYQVWRTADKNNDGNPDNGADPAWTLVATLPAPATADFQTYNDVFTAESYYDYVVVHDCTP